MKLAGVMLILFSCAALFGQAPDAKPAFEVASIKSSAPIVTMVTARGGPGTNDPGLFTCENYSLTSLVATAFDIPFYRVTAPDWMDHASFIVIAKVPAAATKEQFHLMMQNLLAERFKLAVHRETKEMQTYELVVAKSGLKAKLSAELESKQDASEPDQKKPVSTEQPKLGKDGYPTLPEGFTMAIMKDRARVMYPRQTMDFLANMLSSQVGHPVNDATGLKGKYDIAFYWDAGGAMRRAPASGNTPLAGGSEPGPDLFEAVQTQLGLKLESKKGWVEIIVVDHMERVPTEN